MQDKEKQNNQRDATEKQASRKLCERTYPKSVPALLRQCQRSERGRLRKAYFERQRKEQQETLHRENARLCAESECLRRENASALRLVLRMTRRYERLRRFTETLHDWITAGTPIDNKPTGITDPDRAVEKMAGERRGTATANGGGNEP